MPTGSTSNTAAVGLTLERGEAVAVIGIQSRLELVPRLKVIVA
jgi:hypothetical protein